jgi:hypothetical protein
MSTDYDEKELLNRREFDILARKIHTVILEPFPFLKEAAFICDFTGVNVLSFDGKSAELHYTTMLHIAQLEALSSATKELFGVVSSTSSFAVWVMADKKAGVFTNPNLRKIIWTPLGEAIKNPEERWAMLKYYRNQPFLSRQITL